ncbi:MAG: TIGR04086 family membrane protein [Lachnospiraceae bacterium]|nr:TIGR04086 family membrane protein [Lachnospiraceae bacterium]
MGKGSGARGVRGVIGAMALSILPAAITAAILILAAAFCMDRFSLGEDTLTKVVYVIHFAAAFACGFTMGKLKKEKKFLWGLAAGAVWFALILLCGLAVYHQGMKTDALISVLAACAGGSMLGGMVS